MEPMKRLDDDPKHRRIAQLSVPLILSQLEANLEALVQWAAANAPADIATAEAARGNLDDLKRALWSGSPDLLDEPNEETKPYEHPKDCPHPDCDIPF